jgi:hypothetical protein
MAAQENTWCGLESNRNQGVGSFWWANREACVAGTLQASRFFSFIPIRNNFPSLLLGLWSCGQRAALSKRLWSLHSSVQQAVKSISPEKHRSPSCKAIYSGV